MTSDNYTPTIEEVRNQYSSLGNPEPDTAHYESEAAYFDRWLAEHDAGVRADQAAVDASIAECFPGPLHSQQDIFVAEDIAATIRAVALTPTTEETEQ